MRLATWSISPSGLGVAGCLGFFATGKGKRWNVSSHKLREISAKRRVVRGSLEGDGVVAAFGEGVAAGEAAGGEGGAFEGAEAAVGGEAVPGAGRFESALLGFPGGEGNPLFKVLQFVMRRFNCRSVHGSRWGLRRLMLILSLRRD